MNHVWSKNHSANDWKNPVLVQPSGIEIAKAVGWNKSRRRIKRYALSVRRYQTKPNNLIKDTVSLRCAAKDVLRSFAEKSAYPMWYEQLCVYARAFGSAVRMTAKTLPVPVLCLSWHFSRTRQLFERKEPVLLTVIQVINRNNQLVGRMNGFRIRKIVLALWFASTLTDGRFSTSHRFRMKPPNSLTLIF